MPKATYIESIQLIERLHRRFLDVVKAELDRLRMDDINNVQALVLYNIGSDQMTVGELTNRGYYLGSNVSYNIKKLTENGYIIQEKAPHDKRSTRIRLSDKGLRLCEAVDALYQSHIELIMEGEPTVGDLVDMNDTLRQLERFWSDRIDKAYRQAHANF